LHNIFSSLLNPPAPPSPSSLTAEDVATFYTEKIERICQTFTSLPTSPTSHSQHSTTPSLTQLSTVASEEVLQITRSCNPTTCPLDPIPSAMLQTISPDLLPFITTVINGSLTSGHVPTAFKKARVIPILKKAALDPSDISNYRPVSLLSFLSKILERVVCNQLSDYLMQNNLHDPNQSGFKAAHSTETALLAVTEKLHAARSAKLSSVLILLDLSAAFDTVNHKTLLSTLRSLGICGTAWEWFASYLDGCSYQVTWRGLTSAPRRLSTGVPQGSVLGLLLFSLYTHSLGKVISPHGFSYHCYADDTQLIFSFPPSDTTASARISSCLVDISSWIMAHHLKLNPSKTELLFIPGAPTRSSSSSPEITTTSPHPSPETNLNPLNITIIICTAVGVLLLILGGVIYWKHRGQRRGQTEIDDGQTGQQKEQNDSDVLYTAINPPTIHNKAEEKVGCELEEKERFWSELDEVMESIPRGERVVIGADFNGHVGEGNTGDEEVMGKFGVKERNLEGQMVVDFAKRMDMAVVNTYFQKREEHRVTYKSGGRRTQVDYILCRRGNLKEISDCKVVVGESVARQHRMVVCRMTLLVCKKKRSKIEKKTRWGKLKKEECCEEFRQKLRQALGGQVVLPDDWETTAEVIRETGRKVLGVSSGRRIEDKETWWWNEEVQYSIQRKRLAKEKWDMDRTEENRQEYKELRIA
ncbi:hypothetical protein QTP86_017045, partial [Hemibagrus guttatus]